jgi:uncharacterized protein
MLKIGVISDTHLDRVPDEFKDIMKRVFHDVDMIIHSGDMTSRAVYDYLSNWGLKAVRGNMDDFDLRDILPEKRVEEIGGKRIGIIHGRGSPYGLSNFVFKEFQDVDIIIFGHSHVPFHMKTGNVEMFNPGSFKGFSGQAGTVGLIEIGEEVSFKHIEIIGES